MLHNRIITQHRGSRAARACVLTYACVLMSLSVCNTTYSRDGAATPASSDMTVQSGNDIVTQPESTPVAIYMPEPWYPPELLKESKTTVFQSPPK
jgi:hypothetical protein